MSNVEKNKDIKNIDISEKDLENLLNKGFTVKVSKTGEGLTICILAFILIFACIVSKSAWPILALIFFTGLIPKAEVVIKKEDILVDNKKEKSE